MRKQWFITFALGFLLLGTALVHTPNAAAQNQTGTEQKGDQEYQHDFIKQDEMDRLLKEGHSKKDILKAAHIAKYADKNIDEVLKTYKEKGSWEETAQHYGLDLEKMKKDCHEKKEKFLQEHKDDVIDEVAEYTGKTEEEINGWVNNGVPLRFIVAGAAMAKASGKDLSEIVQMKQDGKSFKEIMEGLGVNKEKMHQEMNTLMKKIKEDIKD